MLIFCFHHVEPLPRIKKRKPFTITPMGLRLFILFLRLTGMKIISLKEVIDNLPSNALNNNRLCAITFDDGYENLLEHGLPVLTELECPATVFVLGKKFAGVNDWDPLDYEGQIPDRLLSLEQMRAMAETGLIYYGSHGLFHRNMAQLDSSQTEEEILESFDILSKGLSPYFLPIFAYPWGECSPDSLKILMRSSYLLACTTNPGAFTERAMPFLIPRYSIDYRFTNPIVMILKLLQYRINTYEPKFPSLLQSIISGFSKGRISTTSGG